MDEFPDEVFIPSRMQQPPARIHPYLDKIKMEEDYIAEVDVKEEVVDGEEEEVKAGVARAVSPDITDATLNKKSIQTKVSLTEADSPTVSQVLMLSFCYLLFIHLSSYFLSTH